MATEAPKSLDHRRAIREKELEAVIRFLEPGSRVLEIGAGAGWQAKALAEKGFQVSAIDIPSSNYSKVQVWPVEPYDGKHIPLPDGSVDAVFSSNVLEHVPHIVEFQKEMMRVLKPGGKAVHVMPSATWRLWSSLTYYPEKTISKLGKKLRGKKTTPDSSAPDEHPEQAEKSTRVGLAKFLPPRHGERGTIITEAYYFSRYFWRNIFERAGWNLEQVVPNHLLYSGYRLFGHRLGVETRTKLSRYLGSSCTIYVMRKK